VVEQRQGDVASSRNDLVEAEGLHVRYPSGAVGVSSVSIRVQPSQVVAVLGATGAGKTTCMRALGGFLRTEGARITAGRVNLDGLQGDSRKRKERS
jgi:branched-chain amino acid transport system ATP-binding protein